MAGGRGACVAGGVHWGMHGGGHVWWGTCMIRGVCGRGHVWLGDMHGLACLPHGWQVGGTILTGMLTCCSILFNLFSIRFTTQMFK